MTGGTVSLGTYRVTVAACEPATGGAVSATVTYPDGNTGRVLLFPGLDWTVAA